MPSSLTRGLLLLAGLCCLAPSSQAEELQDTEASNQDSDEEFLPSYNVIDIALALYQLPASWPATTNSFFSPVSIAIAFAMLSLGTKEDTNSQILEGLEFFTKIPEAQLHERLQHLLHALQSASQPQVTIGNSLFIDKSLKLQDRFVEQVKELYDTDTVSVNFTDLEGAKEQINRHVEKETDGEIVDPVKDLENNTALTLVNYISFHGKWNDEFQAERIVEEDFHVNEETTIRVPMVWRLGRFKLHQDKVLSSWVLEQHYMGKVTAFFFLPDPGKMPQLVERLTQEHFENILRLIKTRPANVHFPRLSISATHDMKMAMSMLGITKIFSNEADLSGVTEGAPMKLSVAVHKAVLTLDERGTETTGATGLEESAWAEVPIINFNRPFLFTIRNQLTNVPLFLGRVVNPTEQELL